MIEHLLHGNAMPDAQNVGGSSPLLCRRWRLRAAGHDCPHCRWSALHFSADGGHVDAIQLLLARKAPLDAKDGGGWVPAPSLRRRLLSAVLGGRRAAGEGCRRWTALHCAACKGRTNAIAALLAAGADESAKNNGGHVPLDIVPQTTAAGAQFGLRWQWRRAGTPQRRRQRATERLWHTRTLLPWCTAAGGASSIALRSRWRTHGVATWPETEHLLRPYR